MISNCVKIIIVLSLLSCFYTRVRCEDSNEQVEHPLAGSMVLIPAGKFQIGASPGDAYAKADEQPVHMETIEVPFYMARTECTFGQFRRFVADSGYVTDAESDELGGWGYDSNARAFHRPPKTYSWRHTGFPQTESSPVVNVTPRDAIAYCNWLSEQDGNFRFRLPTEIEWEYACRGGTTTPWYTGDGKSTLKQAENLADLRMQTVFDSSTPEYARGEAWDDGAAFTSEVGNYAANPFGLHDMLGNVSEWCAGYYDKDRYLKPRAPVIGEYHLLRGGNFVYPARSSRCSSRNRLKWNARWCNVGFRVVRDMMPADQLPAVRRLTPLYRFRHAEQKQYYYAYGPREVESLRGRQEISDGAVLGYVSLQEEERTTRLWRYRSPDEKQYFLHHVSGGANDSVGKKLRDWLKRSGTPNEYYRVWVWTNRRDPKRVPVYATSLPDGTDMFFTTDRDEYQRVIRDTRNSLGIERMDFGIAFYIYKQHPDDIDE